MANLYQQVQLQRCRYASRGCTSIVRHEALLSHHMECGFAPVQCSHDGCEAMVNRQDLDSHQQTCESRSVTCDDCHETMRQREYRQHNCVLLRELAEVRGLLREIQGGQQLRAGSQPYATQGQQSVNVRHETSETQPIGAQGRELIQVEATQIQQVVTRRLATEFMGQPNATPRQLTGACISPDIFRAACSISSPIQSQPTVNKQIVVAGGGHKSYEIFNWSTQTWTLYEDSLFFQHNDAFSFLYDNKMMICGGTDTNRVEYLDITNNECASTFPVQLPKDCGKGVLCGDKILTFGQSVQATSLKPPFQTTFLSPCYSKKQFTSHGVAYVNENAVVIIGGYYKYPHLPNWTLTDDVLLYNPTTKQMSKLAPLPSKLVDMAVVVHNDNLIILGGSDGNSMCNSVLMYNITNQHCRMLPKMLQNRSRFAAVIMGDTVVAMGESTAEYLVLGERTWKKLPRMHRYRFWATACVLP